MLHKRNYYTKEIITDLMLQRPKNRNSMENDDSIDSFDSNMIYHGTIGHQMAGSYVNFCLSNYAVIVPQLHDKVYDSKGMRL